MNQHSSILWKATYIFISWMRLSVEFLKSWRKFSNYNFVSRTNSKPSKSKFQALLLLFHKPINLATDDSEKLEERGDFSFCFLSQKSWHCTKRLRVDYDRYDKCTNGQNFFYHKKLPRIEWFFQPPKASFNISSILFIYFFSCDYW